MADPEGYMQGEAVSSLYDILTWILIRAQKTVNFRHWLGARIKGIFKIKVTTFCQDCDSGQGTLYFCHNSLHYIPHGMNFVIGK